MKINSWSDSSYADHKPSMKSTLGYIIRIGDAPIHWKSSLSENVATSSMVAELFAYHECAIETIWVRRVISEMFNIKMQNPTPIHCDNAPVKHVVENVTAKKGVRHLDVKYASAAEWQEQGLIKFEKVSTLDQIADILTKPLSVVKVINFNKKLHIE
jgi:hypothetical protein